MMFSRFNKSFIKYNFNVEVKWG